MNTINFKFQKEIKLLNFNKFMPIFKKPNIVNSYFIVYLNYNTEGYARIGIIIKKKQIRLAYQRNRIKRLIRENFRLNQHYLLNKDFLIILKKEILNLDNKTIKEHIEQLWQLRI